MYCSFIRLPRSMVFRIFNSADPQTSHRFNRQCTVRRLHPGAGGSLAGVIFIGAGSSMPTNGLRRARWGDLRATMHLRILPLDPDLTTPTSLARQDDAGAWFPSQRRSSATSPPEWGRAPCGMSRAANWASTRQYVDEQRLLSSAASRTSLALAHGVHSPHWPSTSKKESVSCFATVPVGGAHGRSARKDPLSSGRPRHRPLVSVRIAHRCVCGIVASI